jgi:hypothetical protein
LIFTFHGKEGTGAVGIGAGSVVDEETTGGSYEVTGEGSNVKGVAVMRIWF